MGYGYYNRGNGRYRSGQSKKNQVLTQKDFVIKIATHCRGKRNKFNVTVKYKETNMGSNSLFFVTYKCPSGHFFKEDYSIDENDNTTIEELISGKHLPNMQKQLAHIGISSVVEKLILIVDPNIVSGLASRRE